jgi:sigma-54 dependent transcriptional regulator, flagellar regulatory protein
VQPIDSKTPIDLKDMLETLELERIQMALDSADGVISEAARMLTLKRTTLIEKMRKYGVDRSC